MQIPVKKNQEYIVDIIDNGYEGEGIAKIENFTIFINGAIKGEKCKILILKVTTSHAFAKIIEIIKLPITLYLKNFCIRGLPIYPLINKNCFLS